MKAAQEEDIQLKKKHQQLFEEELLSWGMLDPILSKGYQLLDKLNAEGVIPGEAVPVLKERLALEKCICGKDLSEGSKARQNVMELIEQQGANDAFTEQLSSLYYQAKGGAGDLEHARNQVA